MIVRWEIYLLCGLWMWSLTVFVCVCVWVSSAFGMSIYIYMRAINWLIAISTKFSSHNLRGHQGTYCHSGYKISEGDFALICSCWVTILETKCHKWRILLNTRSEWSLRADMSRLNRYQRFPSTNIPYPQTRCLIRNCVFLESEELHRGTLFKMKEELIVRLNTPADWCRRNFINCVSE